MDYVKKKHVDKNDMQVSFWSTDDNVLCQDEKTLRENLNEVNTQLKDIAKNKADKTDLDITYQDYKDIITSTLGEEYIVNE